MADTTVVQYLLYSGWLLLADGLRLANGVGQTL